MAELSFIAPRKGFAERGDHAIDLCVGDPG